MELAAHAGRIQEDNDTEEKLYEDPVKKKQVLKIPPNILEEKKTTLKRKHYLMLEDGRCDEGHGERTSAPLNGDKILVLQKQWLDLILQCEKKLEIRGRRFRPGTYFLGCKSLIYGIVQLGKAEQITDVDEWIKRRSLHCVSADHLPYKRTFAIPILHVEKIDTPLPYIHPRGAVGIVRYRQPTE